MATFIIKFDMVESIFSIQYWENFSIHKFWQNFLQRRLNVFGMFEAFVNIIMVDADS